MSKQPLVGEVNYKGINHPGNQFRNHGNLTLIIRDYCAKLLAYLDCLLTFYWAGHVSVSDVIYHLLWCGLIAGITVLICAGITLNYYCNIICFNMWNNKCSVNWFCAIQKMMKRLYGGKNNRMKKRRLKLKWLSKQKLDAAVSDI